MTQQDRELSQGLGWFMGRWRKVFERLDKEAIAADVQKLTEQHPEESPGQLARRIVRRTARSSAALGLATAGPALIPGIGTAISIVGIVPEEIYLIRMQCKMVLQLAIVYGFDPQEKERLYEVVMLARVPTTSIELLMAAKYDLRRMAAKATVHLGSNAGKRTLLGLKTASRGVVKRLPALGFLAGGAINYYSINSLGKKATRFYAQKSREEEAVNV